MGVGLNQFPIGENDFSRFKEVFDERMQLRYLVFWKCVTALVFAA